MIQMDFQSLTKNQILTPTPSVGKKPTPTPPKTSNTLQPYFSHDFRFS